MSIEALKKARDVFSRISKYLMVRGDELSIESARKLAREILPSISAAIEEAEKQEPVEYQYQDRDGAWHCFINEKHKLDTIADGTWPIRRLYTHLPKRKWVGLALCDQEQISRRAELRLEKNAHLSWRTALIEETETKLKELNI